MNKILALDFGLRNIGVAMSDPSQQFAFAQDSLPNDNAVFTILQRVVQQENIERIVIGRSTSFHVEEKAIQFVERLKKTVPVPIEFIDEMLTTKLALDIPLTLGMKKKKRQNFDDDSAAAGYILEHYLNSTKNKK